MNQISWLSRKIHIIECQSVLHDHTSIEYCFGPSSQLLVGIQCPKYALVLLRLDDFSLNQSTRVHKHAYTNGCGNNKTY